MDETDAQMVPAPLGPVERNVRPRSEWEHLLPYGYAPGNYMGACRTCWTVCIDLDKRAASCRPCAEAKYAAREFTPAELVRMNEVGRAKPGVCGA